MLEQGQRFKVKVLSVIADYTTYFLSILKQLNQDLGKSVAAEIKAGEWREGV